MFKTNVGTTDRVLRILVGAILVAVYFMFPGNAWWVVLALIVGIVMLVTGLFSTCPAYSLIGVSTCSRKVE